MQKKKILILGGSIILIVAIFTLIFLAIRTKNSSTNLEETEKKDSTYYANLPPEEPIIDYDNLENAKMVDGEKVNTSSVLAKDHYAMYDADGVVSKLLISDVAIHSDKEKDVTYFLATFTNKGFSIFPSCMVTVSFLNKNGQYVYSIDYFIDKDIKPDQSIQIDTYDLEDFVNVYDYQVRILA